MLDWSDGKPDASAIHPAILAGNAPTADATGLGEIDRSGGASASTRSG